MIIKPKITDLGELLVRRTLPSPIRKSVGPFVFWDHFGPVTLAADQNMDVRPHPHIGLATLTWLFDGEIMHRDSLGYEQNIKPGAVNWMTAGRGIVHSERTPESLRGQAKKMHGLQIWLALPEQQEQRPPGFQHYPPDAIPELQLGDVSLSLIAGRARDVASPVEVYSPLCYLSASLNSGDGFEWQQQYSEEALYVVDGCIDVNGTEILEHHMFMLYEKPTTCIKASKDSRIAILGGEPLGKRYLWWNFVASSRERLKEAADDWASGGFDRINGDEEFIPLPEKFSL